MVAILTAAYTVSFIDRQVLNLLVEPLKLSFDLSDTRLSLLQGLAFTGAYVLFSPVFGRLTDTGNRRNLVALGIVLWSVGTAFCGLARSYWQLFAGRFTVGGAEASLTPAAWSMIMDRFPPEATPRALSVYLMGPYLGGGLALIFGGLILDLATGADIGAFEPWQIVFLAAAVPGFVLAAICIAFVKEPERRMLAGETAGETMSLAEVRKRFSDERAFYLNFYLGMTGIIFVLYAYPSWMPALLMRKFEVAASTVGLHYGVLVLLGGSLGVLTGPWVARLIKKRGRRDALMVVPVFVAGTLVLLSGLLALANSYVAVLAIAGAASFVYSLPMALASSALQLVTPNRMRGMSSAVYVFIVSVIGLGAAPTIVALITDFVLQDESKVGLSVAIACGLSSLLAVFFLRRALAAYDDMLGRGFGSA